jgi:hypothetical protein
MEEISCLQLSLFCVRGYLTTLLVSELHIVERFVDWRIGSFLGETLKLRMLLNKMASDHIQIATTQLPVLSLWLYRYATLLNYLVLVTCITRYLSVSVVVSHGIWIFRVMTPFRMGGKCRLYVHPDRKVVHTYQSIRFRIPYILVLRWGKIRRQRFFSEYLGFFRQ